MRNHRRWNNAETLAADILDIDVVGDNLQDAIRDRNNFNVFVNLANAHRQMENASFVASKKGENNAYSEEISTIRERASENLIDLINHHEITLKKFTGTVVTSEDEIVLDDSNIKQSYHSSRLNNPEKKPKLGELVTATRQDKAVVIEVVEDEDKT